MTQRVEWCFIRGTDKREFTVHFTEDAPERAEAVEFFRVREGHLYSVCPVTNRVWAMSVADANAYFAANPGPQLYESLYLNKDANITDEDLARLTYIPELIRFRIFSNRITDTGVRHIASSLSALENLCVYSPLITDACLDAIAQLKALKTLDLQASPQITREAFGSLLERLPKIVNSYGPRG
jgi:hypothetical protein